jgi:hypothetical protein
MRRSQRFRSPAIPIAVLALVAALGGVAVAGPATTSVSKKKTKKIAKQEAKKQVNKQLPIEADNLADGAVTGSKIAAGAIDVSKVANSVPAAHVTNSAAETITDQVAEVLTFNQERYDTADMHSDAQSSRLTAPVTGIYEVSANIIWAVDATGGRDVYLRKNGSAANLVADQQGFASTGALGQSVSAVVRLEAGDYVEVAVTQTSGGNLNVTKTAEGSPEFSMTWLAPGPA